MQTSEQIHEIAGALAKAQGAIAGASKDSANPFFKSKYADLASVWDACRGPLSENGIAIIQSPSAEGAAVTVSTLMVHTSGQWIRNTLTVSAKEDTPQAIGSAITYLRRYVLQSLAGVAPEDDDAEAAHGRTNGSVQRQEPSKAAQLKAPQGYEDWWTDLCATADNGEDTLRKAWEVSAKQFRSFLLATNQAGWDALKVRAAKSTPQAVA